MTVVTRWLVASLAFALLSPISRGQEAAGWSLLDASPWNFYRFEDGSFVSPERGWIVNGDGEVFQTADGGQAWSRQAVLPAYLRSVVFVNDSRGFIGTLTQPNMLYETRDAGRSYQDISDRIKGPRPWGICGLWAVNDDVIYGAGWFAAPAHIVKSTDGGQTWTSTSMDAYAGSLIDVYFWDEQRGIAVGGTNGLEPDGRALVLLTEDGGETWTTQYVSADPGEWSWKISFPTPTTGYVSVEELDGGFPAKVLKTTDAGVTWTELSIPNSDHLQAIGFITEDTGWASGRGTTSLTTDGGETWTPIDLDGSINRFEFFGDSLAYAMGRRIYQYAAPPATSIDEGATPRAALALQPAFPNPSTGGVTIPYSLDEPAAFEVVVYDLTGRRVAVVAKGERSVGAHEAYWDGRDARGDRVAPGGYVVALTANGRRISSALLRM
ncbi:MAG: YCF48-related protein [Bacteroidota bacterium]